MLFDQIDRRLHAPRYARRSVSYSASQNVVELVSDYSAQGAAESYLAIWFVDALKQPRDARGDLVALDAAVGGDMSGSHFRRTQG